MTINLRTQNPYSVLIWLCLLCCTTQMVHSQKFDQNYAAWKAKQEAIDAQLLPQQSQSKRSVSGLSSASSSGAKVSLNSAGLSELMQLSGVGEKKAQAILDYRQQQGAFQQIEDLMKVKGIGPALFEKNKARLGL